MKRAATPILDPRDAVRVLAELLARRPGYLPEWQPAAGQPGQALLEIFARYTGIAVKRLNQAPDKNLLAFLDTLGIALIPAQPARAPVVFTPLPGVDGRAPARTRVGAEGEDGEPVVFETESGIAVAGARLAEVRTLWPARDEVADHSVAAAGGRPFTLFESRQPVPHELYLAHDTLFALAGESTVEIEFELATPGSQPFEQVVWELWDGQVWRPFRAFDPEDEDASKDDTSKDGTAGLTRSGVVTLRLECGESQTRRVSGIETHWIRGRLDEPLAPDPDRVLPEVDRIRVRSAMERPATWQVEQHTISGSGVIRGTVKHADGSPISKAGVSLTWEVGGRLAILDGRVDEDGNFCLKNLSANDYTLGVFAPPLPPAQILLHLSSTSSLEVELLLSGEHPDQAFADGIELDLTKTFLPLGQQPQPGSVFYFSSGEVFTKPGATMTIDVRLTAPRDVGVIPPLFTPRPRVAWEYWGGQIWAPLTLTPLEPPSSEPEHDPTRFLSSGSFTIQVPITMVPREVNGVNGLWMRARLTEGGYGFQRTIRFGQPSGTIDGITAEPPPQNSIDIVETVPPAVALLSLGYSYRSPWESPEHVVTHNDFCFDLHSGDIRWPGNFFPPFRPVSDATPSLYLGLDRPLPNDRVSLFADVEERGEPTPPLAWEAWDGERWRELEIDDETAGLKRPGRVSFLAPDVAPRPRATLGRAEGRTVILPDAFEAAAFRAGDEIVIAESDDDPGELARIAEIDGHTVTLETPLETTFDSGIVRRAALPRFGRPLDWVRARLEADGAPAKSRLRGLHLNAAWALQVQTLEGELLGSASGQPGQSFFFTQIPVLPGEEIEVRELSGERAAVELPVLREELLGRGFTEDDLRTVADPRSGRVTEVWVRWRFRPQLFFSGPDDRHYTLERARGRLIFGDGRHGRLPPVGANNVRARLYRAGGGLAGNVPAAAITQLLGAAPGVQAVVNPRGADGGADGETPDQVKSRGPETLRHLGRSIAARDYEALAREASPGVAAVRALPATAANGRPAPGWVTVIIVPQSRDPRPQPSFELRRRVHSHLAARAPATLAPERIAVVGPEYLELGVVATVVPRVVGEAGEVERRLRAALAAFLHPLTGGPEGHGWPLGRDAYLSDFAALIEAVDGVDHAEELQLLVGLVPRGEVVRVPPDRMVVAGTLAIEMRAPGGAR